MNPKKILPSSCFLMTSQVRYTTMVFSHELMEAHVPVHLPDLEIHPTEATKVPMGKMDLLEDVISY